VLGINRKILFELAKLGSELRHLRRLIERNSLQSSISEPSELIVDFPELENGPIDTVQGYVSLVQRTREDGVQRSLVKHC
jgi:hypothetical protein